MARPRSQEAHRAALDATVALLLESGIDGVTLDEVAARSGVAKSTLYRHFGSKEGLVATAARGCVAVHATPDTGNLADDLSSLFSAFSDSDDAKRFPDLLPMLIDAGKRDEMIQSIVDEVMEQRRRPIKTVIQLAQLRGEIDRNLDLDDAIAIIVGPLTYRKLVERLPVTPEFKAAVLRGAVAALRSTADPAGAVPVSFAAD